MGEFFQNFRVADAADIVLLAFVLYWILLWFKETASRRVLVGVCLVMVVYFVARFFDMNLTSMVFQSGFAVFVIVLVVVFQEDLRRLFERLATFGSFRPLRKPPVSRADVDPIVEAVFNLASARTGALIVLQGKEPLDRHLDGGVLLRGQISKPLLYSIFDKGSPGHDGAVVIKYDRVEKFSVHLPISKNHKEIVGRGTRHSAGLGLSECCDALVLVVSEERGVVSVAEEGKFRPMASAADLKSHLDQFLETKFPQPKIGAWKRLITQNGGLKALAILLAILAWLLLAYNPGTIRRTYIVPIDYRNLAKEFELDDGAPDHARVTLMGSEQNFRFLDPASLRISINLQGAAPGSREIGLSDKQIKLPLNLSTYRIEPNTIQVNIKK